MPFKIELNSVEKFGRDLVRPEGVMALKDGTVWTSHGGGHCTRIAPDGSQKKPRRSRRRAQWHLH